MTSSLKDSANKSSKGSIDSLSLCVVKVYAIDQAGIKHPATAFLYERLDKTYIVTNWHVLTGRFPNDRNVSKTGALVTHLEVIFHFTPDGIHIAPYENIRNTYEVLDTSTMVGAWLEHKDPEIDIALLEIAPPEKALRKSLDKVKFESGYEPTVSEEVFVIGFPEGLTVPTTTLPLWKGGTVAADPAVPIGRKPRNLIDCDTYEGMSGAPVIARRQSGLFRFDDVGKLRGDSVVGEVRQFFGIYSGRVRQKVADEFATTKFGVVWDACLIDEILASPIPGCILR